MTVLDQLRAHEHCATREAELRRRAEALLDVIQGDLTRGALFTAIDKATNDLVAYLNELDDQQSPPATTPAQSKDTRPPRKTAKKTAKTAKKTARKASAKKTVSKASTSEPRPSRSTPRSETAGGTDTRECEQCHTTKPLTAFSPKGRGRRKVCDDCRQPTVALGNGAAPQNGDAPTNRGQFFVPSSANSHAVTARCAVHGVVATNDDNRDPAIWLAVARSKHRADTRCDKALELVQPARVTT